MRHSATQVYQQLLERLGPQQWWPGDSPFEVMVGAVLVQNTAWKNVTRAIDNLRDAGLLELPRLAAVSYHQMEELIRPAGYYRIKAKRLRGLLNFIMEQYDGSIEAMRAADRELLRDQLLAVYGIGPETADSILLYALDKPALVVDTYTHRIFARHGWVDYDCDYHQLQEHLSNDLPLDLALYNEFHALLVNVGHHYCRKTDPLCGECPLLEMLPENGIVLPED